MYLILILSGLALIIFRYTIQKTNEKREDRRDRLNEKRQEMLDAILKAKDRKDKGDNATKDNQ